MKLEDHIKGNFCRETIKLWAQQTGDVNLDMFLSYMRKNAGFDTGSITNIIDEFIKQNGVTYSDIIARCSTFINSPVKSKPYIKAIVTLKGWERAILKTVLSFACEKIVRAWEIRKTKKDLMEKADSVSKELAHHISEGHIIYQEMQQLLQGK